MTLKIKIGTRASPLAVAQAEIISDGIMRRYRDADMSIIKIKTSGDRNLSPFSSDPSGIKGMFTLELEQALLGREIDLAVHSLKDLPANVNEALPIVAYSRRADPRDALIVRGEGLGVRGVIGSSSLRRRLQLERIFPDAKIIPVRGNVNTRLRKLDAGEFSGLVLAVAGLERLGLSERVSKIFEVDEVMPAPGQGILACQGRGDEDYFYLDAVRDEESKLCAKAERSFARALNAGCNVPVGAYARVDGGKIFLRGLYIDERTGKFFSGSASGNLNEAETIGETLAKEIFR